MKWTTAGPIWCSLFPRIIAFWMSYAGLKLVVAFTRLSRMGSSLISTITETPI